MVVALTAALLAGSLFSARPVSAEVKAGDQIVGVNVGLDIPFAKGYYNSNYPNDAAADHDLAGYGLGFGAQYLYHLTPALGFGAEYNYDAFGRQKWNIVDANGNGLGTQGTNYHSMDAEAVARYVFMPDQKLNPYAIVGVGMGWVTESVWDSAGNHYGGTASGLAYSVGGGADYSITEKIIAGVDVRWRAIECQNTFNKGSSTSFSMPAATGVSIALKAGYKFGGK
jgi:opacity protein-like surface antigen